MSNKYRRIQNNVWMSSSILVQTFEGTQYTHDLTAALTLKTNAVTHTQPNQLNTTLNRS